MNKADRAKLLRTRFKAVGGFPYIGGKTVIPAPPETTSHIERQNLTMRMGMRRFTRLTNGFSKKVENHEHAIALHYMHYNFGRVHQTLRVTPAMEAGLTDHVWSIEEICRMADWDYAVAA